MAGGGCGARSAGRCARRPGLAPRAGGPGARAHAFAGDEPLALARAVPDGAPPPVVLKPEAPRASVADMVASFAAYGYDLDQVRAAGKPVPRLYLEELPRDLTNISSVATKKRLFVQAVLRSFFG